MDVIERLVRLVRRVGSYTDEEAPRSLVRDLVDELELDGAALWRLRDGELVLDCSEGVAVDRDDPSCTTWPLRVADRRVGVLAVRGAMLPPVLLIVGMLAGRCAHLLDDQRRTATQRALLEGLSHELRAPLQALLGHVDLLRGGTFGPLSDEQAGALESVSSNAEKILAVASDVLQVARIDAGHDRVVQEDVDMEALLRREVDDSRPLAEARGLSLAVECPGGLHVRSDRAKVARILTNLLSNAIKYTERGGVVVRAGEGVFVEVEDTGVGIPEHKLRAVFDEYVRLDRAGEGTGLGLAIARRLAHLLGGELSLTSSEGAGTVARLELPA